MKKKLLSLFMVIAITIFQFATTALSYDLNDGDIINSYNRTIIKVVNTSANVETTPETPGITTWAELQTALNAGGTVTLTQDITAGASDTQLYVDKEVTLDLNGHILNRNLSTPKDGGGVIFVDEPGNLIINDSNPNATHSPAITYKDLITNEDVVVNGGIITGGYNTGDNGAIYFKWSFGTINGGTIVGNKAMGTSTSGNAGGLVIRSSTVTMNGGAIVGNEALYGDSDTVAGGVCVQDLQGSVTAFNVNGGRISDNFTNSSDNSCLGGIYVYASNLNVSGNVKIFGNMKNGKDNNVILSNTSKGRPIHITGALTEGTHIGVITWRIPPYWYSPEVFTEGYSTYNQGIDPSTYFSLDDEKAIMIYDGTSEVKVALKYNINVTNDGNGTASVSQSEINWEAHPTLTATPNEGYRFKEWQVISGDVNIDNNTIYLQHAEDYENLITNVQIKAIFEETKYTVTFKDGSDVLDSRTITSGSTVERPSPDPTKDGNIFKGWYSDAGLTTSFNFSSTITADTTIYAKFDITSVSIITVKEANFSALSEVVAQIIDHNGNVVEEWVSTNVNHVVEGLKTVEEYTLRVTSVPDINLYDIPTDATFTISDTGVITSTGSMSEQSLVIMVGEKTPATYTVIFKDYDGTVLKTQENVEHGSSVTAPSNPTREGFTFKGWDKAFDNVTSDLEVTAIYEIISSGEVPKTEIDDNTSNDMIRSAGKGRYDTAISTASYLKMALAADKFDCVIIASGSGSGATGKFPDALAGSYLAAIKHAPILMVGSDGTDIDKVAEFVRSNLTEGGTVYILGGTGAVPASVEDVFADYNVRRLSGKSRYETNLAILAEAGVSDGMDLIVSDGAGFADALSASALGMPILLIDKKAGALTDAQRSFLGGTSFANVYVVGGTGAVPSSIADEIKAVRPAANVERISGANRYATSIALARKFFPEAKCITIATGKNFPDGLTGGPLSFALSAPLVLTEDSASAYTAAASYAREAGTEKYLVFGGAGSVPDNVINTIMGK